MFFFCVKLKKKHSTCCVLSGLCACAQPSLCVLTNVSGLHVCLNISPIADYLCCCCYVTSTHDFHPAFLTNLSQHLRQTDASLHSLNTKRPLCLTPPHGTRKCARLAYGLISDKKKDISQYVIVLIGYIKLVGA